MIDVATAVSEAARQAEQKRPLGAPVMYQRWAELLFLHWSVDPKVVAVDLPPGLRVDTFDGRAWIGVVPFSMCGVRPRGLPAVGGLSDFPEMNLRTYVYDERGRPGVWFYSLDTPKRLPNWIARTFFNLNYRLARIELERPEAGATVYRSQLRVGSAWDSVQEYRWRREGAEFAAGVGTLEFFLAERYRLFSYDPKRRRLRTGRVHHVPYPLQKAKLDAYSKRLFELIGLKEPKGSPDSVLASSGVDVEIFPMD